MAMAEKTTSNEVQTHEPETRTFAQLHDHHTSLHPEQEAFVIYDEEGQRRSYSFQDIKEQSLTIAALLLQIGLDKGQNVALMAPNRIEFIWNYLALIRIGANVILIPAHGKTEEETVATMERCKCQALLFHPTGDDVFDEHLTENVKRVLGEDRVILIGEYNVFQGLSTPVKFRLSDLLQNRPKDMNFDEVYKRQDSIQPGDPIVCFFTSGSTGVPKAIQYTHQAMVNQGLQFAKHCLGLASSPQPVQNYPCRFFNDRPFSWSVMLGIHQVFAVGFTYVCCPPARSACKCDPAFIQILQDEKCSGGLFLPYLLHDLVAYPRTGRSFDMSHLKHVITGGQVIASSFLLNLASVLPDSLIVNLYGSSEIEPIAIKTYKFDELSNAGMRVCPPTEVKVINDKKEVVGCGEMGEICARSPYRFHEYLGDPKTTSARVDSSGWFQTGDVGYIDQQGGLYICGRMSEAIIKLGVKIYPIEVEKVLSAYPDVKAVSVFGVPDERKGEEVCACVVPKPGSRLKSSVTEFEDWASQQWKADDIGLTRKQKYTLVMEAFPLTRTGKTDRKALKELALQKLGNRIKQN